MDLLAINGRHSLGLLVGQDLLLNRIKSDIGNSSVVAINDLGNFFESRSTSLDIHEVNEEDFTKDPNGVDEVQSPGVTAVERVLVRGLPGAESQRVEVVVEKKRDLNRDVQEHKTLGTQRVRQDFNRITNQKTRPAGRIEDTVEPDEENHGIVSSRSLVLLEKAAGESPEDESKEHAPSGEEEGETTVETFDKQSATNGDNHIENGLSGGDDQALVLTRQASVDVETGRVVRDDTITRPLREEAEGEENNKAISVTLGLEEVGVFGAVVGKLLGLDSVTDLTVLKLDSGMVDIAVGVVLGKNVKSLILTVLSDKESRGLGNPWNNHVNAARDAKVRDLYLQKRMTS